MKLKAKAENELTEYKVVYRHEKYDMGFYGYYKDMSFVKLQKYSNITFIPLAAGLTVGYILWEIIALKFNIKTQYNSILAFFMSAAYTTAILPLILYFIDQRVTRVKDQKITQSLRRIAALDTGNLNLLDTAVFTFQNNLEENLRIVTFGSSTAEDSKKAIRKNSKINYDLYSDANGVWRSTHTLA